jgi:hypothetical protein
MDRAAGVDSKRASSRVQWPARQTTTTYISISIARVIPDVELGLRGLHGGRVHGPVEIRVVPDDATVSVAKNLTEVAKERTTTVKCKPQILDAQPKSLATPPEPSGTSGAHGKRDTWRVETPTNEGSGTANHQRTVPVVHTIHITKLITATFSEMIVLVNGVRGLSLQMLVIAGQATIFGVETTVTCTTREHAPKMDIGIAARAVTVNLATNTSLVNPNAPLHGAIGAIGHASDNVVPLLNVIDTVDVNRTHSGLAVLPILSTQKPVHASTLATKPQRRFALVLQL